MRVYVYSTIEFPLLWILGAELPLAFPERPPPPPPPSRELEEEEEALPLHYV